MPGVPDMASAQGHMGTRTNQVSRIDYREILSPSSAGDAQSIQYWAISSY